MPQDTFFNLTDDKRERVFRAVVREFSRVPLEEASVKNIVKDAAIPRGSFYQYFKDKEDALLYVISRIRQEGRREERLIPDREDPDIFAFLLGIYEREADALAAGETSRRMELLGQIAKSPRAIMLFNEDIQRVMLGSGAFRAQLSASGLDSLDPPAFEAVMELISASLRDSLVSLLSQGTTKTQAREKLGTKLEILKIGIERWGAVKTYPNDPASERSR